MKRTDKPLHVLQAEVDDWIRTVGVRYFNELTNMAILTEEVGELARLMARKYGEQSFKKGEEKAALGEEMADVLFVLLCLANQTGTDLDKAFAKKMKKRTKRDRKRHAENAKLKKTGAKRKGAAS
ncbi:MAG: nucleotide pyrophosphohydrolase [Flavobacteriales bacterium]|nr:nucleotide pyrophosphohydrolase [Flavobacteriales bacterium]